MPSLAETIRSFPPVTRFFTITSVLSCIACSMQLVRPSVFFFSLSEIEPSWYMVKVALANGTVFEVVKSILLFLLQSYRCFTSFLLPSGYFYNSDIEAVLDIYFFYTFANHLESFHGKFHGNFPDCLWFTLVTGTSIILLTLAYGLTINSTQLFIHHEIMLSCLTYYWSRCSKDLMINFMGVIPVKAYYLPLFNIFLKMVARGFSGFLDSFIGIFAGYLYQCIQSDTIPIYNLFPDSYLGYTSNNAGRRVGTNTIHTKVPEGIEDAIFDKGYLKAPLFLYNILKYPVQTSTRETAFRHKLSYGGSPAYKPKETTSDVSPPGQKSAFKGSGRRLGD
ncbi:uncharacterized protein CANTADRAFT_48868 [Suhomyces tanzawaensis NRRL Y-17324]|uniref:Derlin n=1 Tax=Suhomyces tanzawaensis NRRL Y-17324 TaxID=984487 RepID=A0A1E4SJ81_9ASCO|nr:uncharacterized protein CANTADRAFT_48868 [Suhomyces tanzawaensis NRRL Y-17324]ODV79559.1 hypothetical protein CANTADRAFT_48868 [Suhomyces tanzawaensis NRRL Y-17324]